MPPDGHRGHSFQRQHASGKGEATLRTSQAGPALSEKPYQSSKYRTQHLRFQGPNRLHPSGGLLQPSIRKSTAEPRIKILGRFHSVKVSHRHRDFWNGQNLERRSGYSCQRGRHPSGVEITTIKVGSAAVSGIISKPIKRLPLSFLGICLGDQNGHDRLLGQIHRLGRHEDLAIKYGGDAFHMLTLRQLRLVRAKGLARYDSVQRRLHDRPRLGRNAKHHRLAEDALRRVVQRVRHAAAAHHRRVGATDH